MSSTEVSPVALGLDLGSRRFLHPGPLRWLRSLGWAVALFFIFGLAIAAVQIWPELLIKGEGPLRTLATAGLCGVGYALYAGLVRLAEGRWPSELALRPAIVDLSLIHI